MGAGNLSEEPVSIEVVFERFPASVRGAVVVRGLDPDPHQVALTEAEVVELRTPSRPVRPVSVDRVTVDIAPRGEVLLPYDIPFAGLQPGWYALVAEVRVDGQRRVRGPADVAEKRFVVPWPGHLVRRGTVQVGGRIRVPGSPGAAVDRVECRADRAVVRWRHAPSEDPDFREFGELRVLADGRGLALLDSGYRAATGARTTAVYPVLKANRTLTLELDRRYRRGGSPRRGAWSLDVGLGDVGGGR